MESDPAQPAAHFVGSQCRRGLTCPFLRRGRCLFLHSEDETASASLVGQDQPPGRGSVVERLERLERVVEQIFAISLCHRSRRTPRPCRSTPQRSACRRPRWSRSATVCRPSHRNEINQATEHAEITQPHYTDKFVEEPVATGPSGSDSAKKTGYDPSIIQVTKHCRLWLLLPNQSSVS